MPADHMGLFDLTGLVAKRNSAFANRSFEASHVPLIARVARVSIMITPDDFDRERGKAISPVGDCGNRGILSSGLAVKKIPQHEQPLGCVRFDQAGEIRQIVRRGSFGHGHARLAEQRRLTKMRVREDQGFSARPNHRPLRGEHPFFTGELDFKHGCLPMTFQIAQTPDSAHGN